MKVIISSYPDKGRKFRTVKKVCSRVDRTGSAVLRKPSTQAVGGRDLPQPLLAQFVVEDIGNPVKQQKCECVRIQNNLLAKPSQNANSNKLATKGRIFILQHKFMPL